MRADPSSNGHGGGGGATTPANPALSYISSSRSHGQTYQTVAVMDSDYTHQTSIYGDGISTSNRYYGPSWSPTGGSLGFMQSSGSVSAPADVIKAVDVTLNSDGTVSGTNARTVYTLPSNLADNSLMVAWSNTSGTNMIAFGTRYVGDSRRTVWVVPASGGTPVKVWECDSSFVKEDGSVVGHQMPVGWPTWSPDDSHIAFERLDSGTLSTYTTAGTTKAVTIMIFSTTDHGATWTYTDSIKHTSTGANAYYPDLEWSRTGLNKLALWDYEDGHLYYTDPTSGATPVTDGIAGGGISWSPNNSSIVHLSNSSIWKSAAFTTTTYATGTNPSYNGRMQIQWKH
jgi:hypothetical protein